MTELALFSVAKEALAEARRTDEVKDIRDRAVRMRLYGEQARDRTMMADAGEIISRAERKLGELLIAAREAGQLGIGRPSHSNVPDDDSGDDADGAENGNPPEPFSRVTLAEAGITKKLSASAQKMAQLPETAFEAAMVKAREKILSGGLPVLKDATTADKKARRVEREQQLGAKQMALPEAKFGVILTDDEWEHEPWSDAGLAKAAANHYPVSPLEELKKRDVASLAAPDCALFMWTTVPHLAQAIELMAHRGFEYKTNCIWEKVYPGEQHGMGYWFWIDHEILLLGTRGKVPAPAPGTQWRSVIKAPVGEHSEKPVIFHELIEEYFPTLPKIELNARAARDGWVRWGYEAPPEQEQAIETQHPVSHASGRTGATLGRPGDVDSTVSGARTEATAVTAGETAPLARDQQDEIIRNGYAANRPLAELVAATGLDLNVIKGRARRMKLSSRDRQREAVAASNKRRAGE